MRRLALGMLVLLGACDGDPTEIATPPNADAGDADAAVESGSEQTPTLAIVLSPAPYLTGVVSVQVVASPEEAFYGVELALDSAKIANRFESPFTFEFDSAQYPDGPGKLRATGILKATGAPLVAEQPVELANHGPELTVLAPDENEITIGSPSQGFSLRTHVQASDGNRIQSLTAKVGSRVTDLPLDGTEALLPLENVGPEMPSAPIAIEFRAKDKSGAETVVTRHVIASNLQMRFERSVGFSTPYLASIRIAPQGQAVVQVGLNSSTGDGNLYVLSDPEIDAQPSYMMETPMPGPSVLDGDALYFYAGRFGNYQFYRATVQGQQSSLFSLLSSANQQPTVHPKLLSQGQVIAGWFQYQPMESHLVSYTSDGTKLFDARLTDKQFSSGSVIELGQKVLALLSDTAGNSVLQPFDRTTGAALTPWPAPAGETFADFVTSSDEALLVRTNGPATSGPPAQHLALYNADSGQLAWDYALADGVWPQWSVLQAQMKALVFSFASSSGAVSQLQLFDSQSSQVLWQGQPEAHESLLGQPSDDTLIMNGQNLTTHRMELFALNLHGQERWRTPLERPNLERFYFLPDGRIAVSSLEDYSSATDVALELFSTQGQRLWGVTLPTRGVAGMALENDLLAVTYVTADQQKTVYEARKLQDGSLQWRYQEPSPCDLGGAISVLVHSEPWGLLLGPATAKHTDSSGNQDNSVIVLGLVP